MEIHVYTRCNCIPGLIIIYTYRMYYANVLKQCVHINDGRFSKKEIAVYLYRVQQARKFQKVQAKKKNSWNQINQFHEKLMKFHFLQFLKWPKINFWTGKSLKLPKMQFHEIDLFDFTSFFPWTFSNFLAHCSTVKKIGVSRKKIHLFDFRSFFFCLGFFKFSGWNNQNMY